MSPLQAILYKRVYWLKIIIVSDYGTSCNKIRRLFCRK